MGSSFTEYRGRGFWSYDGFLERMAVDVASMIEGLPESEAWLKDLASHWRIQASGNFSGWSHLELDNFISSEERRLTVRGLIQRLIERRHAQDQIGRTGVLLLRLLDGELETDASSPLDYMVPLPAR